MGLRRVMFVDDDPNVLAGLRRSLRAKRDEWDMVFALGGQEALRLLEGESADVVVSDMRMPGMDGGQLLAEVRRRHPQTARMILSGHADRASIVSAVGPTQQFLAKPCDANVLIETVGRVLAVRDLVTDARLRRILGSVENLPKPPRIYEEMMGLAENPDCRLSDVVSVVEADVATTTELLRLVNSAFFGLPSRVATVERAVALLGLETIQSLALAGAVFRSEAPLADGLDPGRLLDRGLAVATMVKRVAVREGWPSDGVADLFLAGALHEIGLLVLASAAPQAWAALRDTDHAGLDDQDEHERTVFGCSVTEASAYLLGLWGFGETVVQALAAQPAPASDVAAAPGARLLATCRRLERYGATDVAPCGDGFLTTERLERWLAHAGLAPSDEG